MIAVLSFYSDGSGKPELLFFPKTNNQAAALSMYVATEAGLAKTIKIYEIESLDSDALCIYPATPPDYIVRLTT